MSFKYTDKYYPRFIRRTESKPAPMRLIMERTFHSAMWVLETIDGVEINELDSAANLFAASLKNREFAFLYKSQLEIAWSDADKFVFGLHSFYNNLAGKIKKERKERDIADFISEVMRYQVTSSASAYNKAVTAYINMMLQTLEYLRPDKFAFDKSIYGVGEDGKFLLGPCPFPYSDIPLIKSNRAMLKLNEKPNPVTILADIIKECHAQGIEIESMEDFERFEQAQRIHVTTIASMLSLITPDTYDILPQKSYCAEGDPISDMVIPIKVDLLAQHLKEKDLKISKSGVTFFFADPECLLEFLLVKEIVRNGASYILYRLNTKFGDVSGYYDIEDEYFYSIFAESEDKYRYDVVRALVLSLYASLVLPVFPPLDKVVLRMSGPVPVGILEEKPKHYEEEYVECDFTAAKDEIEDDSAIGSKTSNVLPTILREDDNMAPNLECYIYPFTWYCISKDERRFEA